MAGDAGEDGLFSIDPAQRIGALSGVLKPAVDETFRSFDPGQGLLLPPSLDDWLAAEHLVRFIAELVDEHLDLSRIQAGYTEGRGGPPYDPQLMVRILLYGYTIGVRSSRAIEVKCTDDVAFRWLAAGGTGLSGDRARRRPYPHRARVPPHPRWGQRIVPSARASSADSAADDDQRALARTWRTSVVYHVVAAEGAKSCWCQTVWSPLYASRSPPPATVTVTTNPTPGSRPFLGSLRSCSP